MNIYSVNILTRKKDGTITKAEPFTVKEATKELAIEVAKKRAKVYGFRGKLHIGSVYVRDENKVYQKVI